MPIAFQLTESEKAAVYAADVLAKALLGVADWAEFSLETVCSESQSQTQRIVDVWLAGKTTLHIRVKLAMRNDRNPERDERWYPVLAWSMSGHILDDGLAVRFRFDRRQLQVQYYDNPPIITGLWTLSAAEAESLNLSPSDSMRKRLRQGLVGYRGPDIEGVFLPRQVTTTLARH